MQQQAQLCYAGGARGADLTPGRLRPVAEAIAVLASAVTQVQAHGGALILDAQGCKGAHPHIHRLFKGKEGIHFTLNVTCADTLLLEQDVSYGNLHWWLVPTSRLNCTMGSTLPETKQRVAFTG